MISATALSKRYGPTTAVADVTFACEPGTVTGFLGPNGAGKSTTLRILTGLTRADSGSSTIAGRPYAQLPNPTRIVGTLLDASAMHSGRTGRAVLRIAADLAGVPQAGRRVAEVLDTVGLSGKAGDRRVGTYSLGMRQRLGIAQALIGDPRVLVLDEPANGLDPEGIAWMRGLLRVFADRGGTVLLSSHLLAEVEATVDRLVVIGGGRVLAQGSMAELLTANGLLVKAVPAAQAALRDLLAARDVPFGQAAGGALSVDAAPEVVSRMAMEAGIVLVELRPSDRPALEELFFTLTNHTNDAGKAA